jgi:hypothetical protein
MPWQIRLSEDEIATSKASVRQIRHSKKEAL